jgi:hypothetical protein
MHLKFESSMSAIQIQILVPQSSEIWIRMTWQELARATSSIAESQQDSKIARKSSDAALREQRSRMQQQKRHTTQLLHSNKSLDDDEEYDVWTLTEGWMQQQHRSAKVSANKSVTTINQKLHVDDKL